MMNNSFEYSTYYLTGGSPRNNYRNNVTSPRKVRTVPRWYWISIT